ncbi:hypothetical protein BDP27DRAFT_1378175 [Rhodocollybia butyracea]|uniref:Uncharacterized protein n=1 Tax=Rhodocollybia butyracea TaxID=206335 RepID=A0A9P5P5C8_9AGAR|nr:hypothetical protein BDP27DRAFT_1378175 [Rhodocollybia butyracea]
MSEWWLVVSAPSVLASPILLAYISNIAHTSLKGQEKHLVQIKRGAHATANNLSSYLGYQVTWGESATRGQMKKQKKQQIGPVQQEDPSPDQATSKKSHIHCQGIPKTPRTTTQLRLEKFSPLRQLQVHRCDECQAKTKNWSVVSLPTASGTLKHLFQFVGDTTFRPYTEMDRWSF